MNVVFENEELELLFTTPLSEIRGKQKIPFEVLKQYKKKVQILLALTSLEQLAQIKGLNFEYLKGDRRGEYSVRLNIQYRLIFNVLNENTFQLILIREISKHYA